MEWMNAMSFLEVVEVVAKVVAAAATIIGALYSVHKWIVKPGFLWLVHTTTTTIQFITNIQSVIDIVQHEFKPNGGTSLTDRVDRALAQLHALSRGFQILDKRHALVHLDAQNGIVELDAHGRIVRANRTYRKLTNMSLDELHDGGWRRTIHPDDLPAVDAEWDRCRRDQIEFAMVYRRLANDGSGDTIRVRTFVHPVIVEGELVGWIGCVEPLPRILPPPIPPHEATSSTGSGISTNGVVSGITK